MVSLGTASIFDDDITEKLCHQFLTIDLRQTVPGIRAGGGDQIEHLHRIALVSKILAGFFIEFRFWVTDYKRVPPGDRLENHIHTERPRLFGAAGPVHSQIPIEPGLLRDTYHLAVQLPQDDAGVFADIGNQIQDTLQLLFGHKARCAVGAFVGVDQVAVSVILAGLAVSHPHDHKHQYGQGRYAAAHTVQAVGPAEYRGDTDKEIGVRELGRGAKAAARRLPRLVVVEELGNKAAAVEQSGDGNGQNDDQQNEFFPRNKNPSEYACYCIDNSV